MTSSSTAPRRVLIVEEGGIGGVANYSDELAAALAAADWEVELATGRDHSRELPVGVRVRPLFAYVRGRGRMGRLLRGLGLSRVVNGLTHLGADGVVAILARRADVVHVQGEEWPPLGAILGLLLRASRTPIIYTPHNTFDRSERSYGRAHAIIRRCASRIVVHSAYDRSTLPAGEAAKTVVIAHGEYGSLARRDSPAVEVGSARAELGVGEEDLVVLLFGQLRPDKGIRDLLEASLSVSGVRIVLAGSDQGALGEVGELLQDPRLRDRVIVRDRYIPSAEMGSLFAACDLVALPYHRASASGVLLLAYGFERPVIVYPVGGLPEYVVEGETGWICAAAEPPALESALREVVQAGREECSRRGEAALRHSLQSFGWEEIARRTIELYEEVLR